MTSRWGSPGFRVPDIKRIVTRNRLSRLKNQLIAALGHGAWVLFSECSACTPDEAGESDSKFKVNSDNLGRS